jgi:hypothetical protein
MTAKQAIKLRCKDCNPDSRICTLIDCPLYGLNKPKTGARRTIAIRLYCKVCLNNHPFSTCTCIDCSIYQYRCKIDSTVEKHIIVNKNKVSHTNSDKL